jgi:hypothetical protein
MQWRPLVQDFVRIASERAEEDERQSSHLCFVSRSDVLSNIGEFL